MWLGATGIVRWLDVNCSGCGLFTTFRLHDCFQGMIGHSRPASCAYWEFFVSIVILLRGVF